jgi:hypothetical protein
MLFVMESNIKKIILNHMVTWKYKFRTVSFKMSSLGTGNNKPAIIEYRTRIIPRVFHHFIFIQIAFLVSPKVWK